jgi:hypothetical protein
VLWGNLPTDMETDVVRAAFYEIDEQFRKATLADLRRACSPATTSSSAPINPMNPPGPEDMEKIAAALCALNDLGLIITL